VDGSHINIRAPSQNGLVYINRKQKHSINVQFLCDNNHYFMDVVAKWPGSAHDSFIFRNSNVCRRFENGEFGDGILIGDSGYYRTPYLLTPTSTRSITPAEEARNLAISRTRSKVERAIGELKGRFRSMHR
jgi:nuclease HARBI1